MSVSFSPSTPLRFNAEISASATIIYFLVHKLCEGFRKVCERPHTLCVRLHKSREPPHIVCEGCHKFCETLHTICAQPRTRCEEPHKVCENPHNFCDGAHIGCENPHSRCGEAHISCESPHKLCEEAILREKHRNQFKNDKNTINMEILIKKDALGFKSQLNTFCGKIDLHAVALGLNLTKVADLKKTNTLVQFVFDLQQSSQQYSQDLSKYTRKLFLGFHNEPLGPIPTAPVYPAILPEVTEPNAYFQFSDLVQDCKRSPNFTSNIAEELGVLAPGSNFIPEDGTPAIKLTINSGGHPHLHLKHKGDYDGFEVWKMAERGPSQPTGGTPIPPPVPPSDSNPSFRKLERVFGVDYVDPEPLPAYGQSEVWHYKIIYIYKNQQAGKWSTIYSISVAGTV